jgi:precorrin-6B methylase 2
MADTRLESGSFRDREGRVSYHDGEVYRFLSANALAAYDRLEATRFFRKGLDQGTIIPTVRADLSLLAGAATEPDEQALAWKGALHHERIPFVSYPYEWPFSMLKDAALLHLKLLQAALAEDFVIKDSTPYNVQWRGVRPTFIDVPSFEPLVKGEPWIGYLQFCQLFLYPLLLTAYKGVPYQPWLRGSVDGIEPEQIDRLFGLRDRLRPGVFGHVYLQSKLQAMQANSKTSLRKEARASGFPKAIIQANARKLEKLISNLEWKQSRSEWSHYDQEHSYASEEHKKKEHFVEQTAERVQPDLTWDLGCNTGRFTRLAAKHSGYAVAMDADRLAIERLYQALSNEGVSNILPLVNNLVDSSPNLGWRLSERKDLATRGRPQLVLALALIHHIVIGCNVPTSEFLDWLATLGATVVLEFVTREDAMVKKLLLNKEDHYFDYERGFFERALARRFTIDQQLELGGGTRILYRIHPLTTRGQLTENGEREGLES